MAEKAVEQQKKGRLGRGLGSLLGGGAQPMSREPNDKIESTKSTSEKPTNGNLEKKEANIPESNRNNNENTVIKNQTNTVPPEARIWKIAIEKLHPNEFQPRQKFNKDTLKDLASSIKDKGILQPIVARRHASGALEIISGERRWRAAQIAGLQEVPVIVRTVNDQESLELAIIENIQREDLNPIDEAEAYQRLAQEFKLTQQQIAEKVSRDRATVANSLRLLLLADQVRDMLVNQEISVGHCKVLLSIDNPKTQTEIARKVVKESLSVRALEKIVSKVQKGIDVEIKEENQKENEVKKRLINSLNEDLQKTLGTKVAIDYSDGKGKVAISFYSDEELNNISEKLRTAWKM